MKLVFDDNFSSVRVIPFLDGIVSGTRKISLKTVLVSVTSSSEAYREVLFSFTVQKTLELRVLIISPNGLESNWNTSTNKTILETRIYSNSNQYSIRDILSKSIKGYCSSFYLARQLAKRDITSQHRQSILGMLWIVFPVLMNALVWIFLQSSGTIQLTPTNIPYPLFALVGTTIWSIFGECLNMPMSAINGNKGIITKINFEKEALITLGLIKIGFNLVIKLGMIVFFMLFFQVVPAVSLLFFIPFLLVTMLFFSSLGILIMPIGILYNDISKMIPIGLQLLMYISPVLYVVPKSGLMQSIMKGNPLSYVITDIRNTLTGMPVETPWFWAGFLAVSLVLSTIAMVVYRVAMPIITERMSA